MKNKYTVTSDNEKTIVFIMLSVFALGMWLLSCSTSPIYPFYYGQDSAIFSLIGKSMISGKTVYRDLFDHKGPILFFIQALGWLLGGRNGIFLIQNILGIINLLFLYGIWKNIRRKQNNLSVGDLIIIFIAGYSVFFYTFVYGNLSEEYSLPFISGCVYLFVRYAGTADENAEHPVLFSLFYGVAIAVLSFMRLNNAVTVCAGVLAIAIYLLHKKKYKNLFLNIVCGITGCAIVVIPVVAYFIEKNALYDMLYATFIHNFKYTGVSGHVSILKNLWKYIVLYFPIVISIIFYISKILSNGKNKLTFFDILSGFIVFANALCLTIANAHQHYFAIYIPVFMLILSRYWSFELKSLKTAAVSLCILLHLFYAACFSAYVIYNGYITKDDANEEFYINKSSDIIPEEEKESVIGYNIQSSFYLHEDIIPCYKYYTHQKLWSKSNPTVKTDFMEYLKEEQPVWVLTKSGEEEKELCEILEDSYKYKCTVKNIDFYRLNK